MSTSTSTAGAPVENNAAPKQHPLARYVEERTKNVAKDMVVVYLACNNTKYWRLAIQKIEPNSSKSLEYYGPDRVKGYIPLPSRIVKIEDDGWGFIELGCMHKDKREAFIECITGYGGTAHGQDPDCQFCYSMVPNNYIVNAWDHAFECGALDKQLYETGQRRMGYWDTEEADTREGVKEVLAKYDGFYTRRRGIVRTRLEGKWCTV